MRRALLHRRRGAARRLRRPGRRRRRDACELVECVPALEPRSAAPRSRRACARCAAASGCRSASRSRSARTGCSGWRRVAARRARRVADVDPGVRRYSYSRTVRNLSAPAVVPDGRALPLARRRRRRRRALARDVARVPPARHAARPRRDGGSRRSPAPLRGRAAQRAAGATPGRSTSRFAPASSSSSRSRSTDLAAGERRSVDVQRAGRARPGEPLTATVDPGGAVDERDEDGNVLVAPCPG